MFRADKTGIDKLLEMILLQADLLELKANPDRNAKGNVIESGVAPGGPTATFGPQSTLHLGDVIICGEFYGKVRAPSTRKANDSRKPGRPCRERAWSQRRAGGGLGIQFRGR